MFTLRSRDGHRLKIIHCKSCGKEMETRADRKHNGYCKVCGITGDRNPLYGVVPSTKGTGTYDRNKYNQNIKKKLVSLNGNECKICKAKNLPLVCYDFHHTNSEDKEYQISQIMMWKWETLEKEIKKCIMVCSNCHKSIHFGSDKLEE